MGNGRSVTMRSAYKTSCLYNPRFFAMVCSCMCTYLWTSPSWNGRIFLPHVRSLPYTSHYEHLGRTHTTSHRRTARFRSILGKHSNDITPTGEFDVILSVSAPRTRHLRSDPLRLHSQSARLHNSKLPTANGTRRVDPVLALLSRGNPE